MRRRREGRAASPGESHGETTRSEVNRPETLDSKRTNARVEKQQIRAGRKRNESNPTADPEARPPGPEKETGASRAGPRACRGLESNSLCVIAAPRGRLEGQTGIGEDTTRNLPEADRFPLRCVLQFLENKFKNRKRNQRRH